MRKPPVLRDTLHWRPNLQGAGCANQSEVEADKVAARVVTVVKPVGVDKAGGIIVGVGRRHYDRSLAGL